MRITIITIMSAVFVMSISNVQAQIDWDFYDDGTIDPCDEYNNVGVYDTPPDHTTVDMLGGMVDSMGAFNESTINVSGGSVNSLYSFDFSNVNVLGGSVYGLDAYDTGTVNIWGDADVFSLLARDYGVVNMSGGIVDNLGAGEFGTVNLSGGIVSENLVAWDSGIINIYGYDLGKIETGGTFGDGFVWGQWEGEIPFSFDFYGSDTHSHVILYEIPEPSMLALIITSVLFLRKRRR